MALLAAGLKGGGLLAAADLVADNRDAVAVPSGSVEAMRGTFDGRSGLKGGAGRFDDGYMTVSLGSLPFLRGGCIVE